jgi:hypothetical protein
MGIILMAKNILPWPATFCLTAALEESKVLLNEEIVQVASSKKGKWNAKAGGTGNYARVLDQKGDVIAMVMSSNDDANLMAASPEMYERLVEVSALRHRSDGSAGKPLLPAEALRAIDQTLRHARGE